MDDDGLGYIAGSLDSRERFVLEWMARRDWIFYGEISGETLDALASE
jgi:hypothetical protein